MKIPAHVQFGLRRTFRSNRIAPSVLLVAVACLLCASLVRGQARQTSPPAESHTVLMADQVHKNLKLLKGIPEDQLMDTMGFFSAALGVGCEFCHGPDSIGNWQGFAEETPMKETARKMMRMVNEINKKHFAGQRLLTCYSCHNGGERPKLIPTLDGIYDPPPPPQPDVITRGPASPTADEILDKYLQALGGAQRLAGLTSFVAKGTNQEVGEVNTNPVEVYAQAPARLSTIVTTMNGVTTTVCDGNAAWIAAPYEDEPVPLLPLSGGALDGARLDAQLNFPAQLKQLLTGWRVGFPYSIGDTETQVVQGFTAAGSPVKLFFDPQSGCYFARCATPKRPPALFPYRLTTAIIATSPE